MIQSTLHTGLWEVHCDYCSNMTEVEAYSFQEAVNAGKEQGFSPVREDGGWLTKCGACKKGPSK